MILKVERVVLVLVEDAQHQEERPRGEEAGSVNRADNRRPRGRQRAADEQRSGVEDEEEDSVRQRKALVNPRHQASGERTVFSKRHGRGSETMLAHGRLGERKHETTLNRAGQSSNPATSVNVADRVLMQAARHPSRVALVIAGERDETITYADLARRIASFSAGLAREGFHEGDRVALLFPLCVDFYALSLAVLRAAPRSFSWTVRGLRRTCVALRISRARAIVSVRAALRLWPVLPATWRLARFAADAAPMGTRPLASLRVDDAVGQSPVARGPDDEGLITFTSGSSGRPKGVDRTHGLLVAQHEALRVEFPTRTTTSTCRASPPSRSTTCALGITTVIPPLDLRRPATSSSGASSRRDGAVGRDETQRRSCVHGPPRLPIAPGDPRAAKVRGLVVGGAPVPRRLRRDRAPLRPSRRSGGLRFDRGRAHRHGVDARCRGLARRRLPGRRRRPRCARRARHAPADRSTVGAQGFGAAQSHDGESGEVVVSGAHVNRRYIGDEEATRRLKMRAEDGTVWHRTGDLANRDARGRLWLRGRTGDVVPHGGGLVLPYVVEADVDELEGVDRAALVAEARGACLALTVRAESSPDAVVTRVRAALERRNLGDVIVRVLGEVPVDARHQSKIDRAAVRAALR